MSIFVRECLNICIMTFPIKITKTLRKKIKTFSRFSQNNKRNVMTSCSGHFSDNVKRVSVKRSLFILTIKLGVNELNMFKVNNKGKSTKSFDFVLVSSLLTMYMFIKLTCYVITNCEQIFVYLQ